MQQGTNRSNWGQGEDTQKDRFALTKGDFAEKPRGTREKTESQKKSHNPQPERDLHIGAKKDV